MSDNNQDSPEKILEKAIEKMTEKIQLDLEKDELAEVKKFSKGKQTEKVLAQKRNSKKTDIER